MVIREHHQQQQQHIQNLNFSCSTNYLLIGIVILALEIVVLNIFYQHYHHKQTTIRFGTYNNIPDSLKKVKRLYLPSINNKANNNNDNKNNDFVKQTKQQEKSLPDGTLNGIPIYYHDNNIMKPSTSMNDDNSNNTHSTNHDNKNNNEIPCGALFSQVHCIGENYQGKLAWLYRSCHFEFLCLDVQEQEFVLYQNPIQKRLQPLLQERPFIDVSQTYYHTSSTNSDNREYNVKNNNNDYYNMSLSLGGINHKWTWRDHGVPMLEWFPKVIQSAPPTSFYTLPPNVVMIPFHSLTAVNPGHLVWDDFLPIYTLMELFQFVNNDIGNNDNTSESNNNNNDSFEPLMIRYVLKNSERGQWASCDWTNEKHDTCAAMYKKFWPLMKPQSSNSILLPITELQIDWTNNYNNINNNAKNKSNLICARHGLAGIGALTDHGTTKMHGWERKDYKVTHNLGRSGQFYSFRNYCMKNMNIADAPIQYPLKIVFSLQSSKLPSRRIDFTQEMDYLQQYIINNDLASKITIEGHVFRNYTVAKQIEVASQASIFISGCGGGAVTSIFQQRGATVILYFLETGGVENNKRTNKPARLDWDLFNNIGYLRVHWLPLLTMRTAEDMDAFVQLIQHEINIIEQELLVKI